MLRGYKRDEAVARDSGSPLDMILVSVMPHGAADVSGLAHSDAVGRVERVLAVRQGSGVCAEVTPEAGAAEGSLTLLNALFAPPASPLGRIVELFLRLDNLSHILVWGRSRAAGPASLDMELVELPRLGLSFRVEEEAGGDEEGGERVLLRSVEHDGLWVSNVRGGEVERLVKGLPHSLILQDGAGDLYILTSSAARPVNAFSTASRKRTHTHTRMPSEMFPCAIILDRGNPEWLANLSGVRHYVYPVHVSDSHLSKVSLASPKARCPAARPGVHDH